MIWTKRLGMVLAAAVLLVWGCGGKEGNTPPAKHESKADSIRVTATDTGKVAPPTRNGVLIHISSGPEDPYQVCMALQVAEEMAATEDVLVYFDHFGTDICFKDTKEVEWHPFPPAKKQIKKLIGMGVQVRVCRPCVDAAYRKTGDLVEGVEAIHSPQILNFTQGKVITLDY